MLRLIMVDVWRGVDVALCDGLRRVLYADPIRVRSPADLDTRPPSFQQVRASGAT